MVNIREVIIRSLSRAIKNGEPVALSSYNPLPPANADEALADTVIGDTLKALQSGQTPRFSGTSSDFVEIVSPVA